MLIKVFYFLRASKKTRAGPAQEWYLKEEAGSQDGLSHVVQDQRGSQSWHSWLWQHSSPCAHGVPQEVLALYISAYPDSARPGSSTQEEKAVALHIQVHMIAPSVSTRHVDGKNLQSVLP